jgi:glycosyltransferase involved in cell wall biosynthesis
MAQLMRRHALRVGIDTSGLRSGGALTHIRELLRAAEPEQFGISEVTLWGNAATLSQIDSRPWLKLVREPLLEGGLSRRAVWQALLLGRRARKACDVLFVPAGTYHAGYRPFVAMSRNMLPFDIKERARYRNTLIGWRLRLLSIAQGRTFRRATGTIFLTENAREKLSAVLGTLQMTVVIPHGVSESFLNQPRPAKPINEYCAAHPFRWIYVSIVDHYKHQHVVAEAGSLLRRKGYPVAIDFVGPSYKPALEKLFRAMREFDSSGEFLRYHGNVPHATLPRYYANADASIFASTCENMPNSLLESMASGLPIACSNRSGIPETLGDTGVYCDPESPTSIVTAMQTLMDSPEARARYARLAFERASSLSWKRAADDTFEFIRSVADRE